MKRDVSTFILGIAVIACAGANWFVAGSVADEPEPAPIKNAAMPSETPGGFDITTAFTTSSKLAEGVVAGIRPADDGRFVLVVKNDGAEERTFKLRLSALKRTGSPMSRMMPPPTEVWNDIVEITVPAGADFARALSYQEKQPQPTGNKQLRSFGTTEFVMVPVAGDDGSNGATGNTVLRVNGSGLVVAGPANR